MAAIAHPIPRRTHRPATAPSRPELRVLEGGRRSGIRPSAEVYRRRRLVALAALALVVFALLAGLARAGVGPLAAPAVATLAPARPPAGAVGSYVVQPGDTWWTIAQRVNPHGDVRPIVDRLVARHGGAALQVGERVSLDD